MPTIGILLEHIHMTESLEVTSAESNGSHYARSVETWKENFLKNWDTIKKSYQEENPKCTDFEIEVFRRKWLVCCIGLYKDNMSCTDDILISSITSVLRLLVFV